MIVPASTVLPPMVTSVYSGPFAYNTGKPVPRPAPALAKLSRPRLYDAVPRERLFVQLDALRGHPVGWMAGPPGAGKTTLAASWIDQRKLLGLWYQVDAGDTDPATFFYYLAALAPPGKRGSGPLPYLTPEYLLDLPGFTRRFFRAFFARLPKSAVLVLDNCQEAAGDVFHGLLRDAVPEVPPGMSIIGISRLKIPSELSRMVANNDLASIEGDELRLTEEEARDIVRASGVEAPPSFKDLHARSDGWAAGLVLLIAHLNRGGTERSLTSLGSKEAIFDYFAGEIFDKAPPGDRDVLMKTALLAHVTPAMAIEISGQAEAPALLDRLYRRQYFTDRRTDPELSYRYHDLFREFLLHRAERSYAPAALNDLRTAVARAAQAAGDAESAIALLLQAANWSEAAAMILARAPTLLSQGRWKTLHDQLAALPEPVIRTSGWLQFWLGCARMQTDLPGSREPLACAFERFEHDGDAVGQMMCAATIANGYYFEFNDFAPLDPWIGHLGRLLDDAQRFPDAATELFVRSAMLLACTFRQPGHRLLDPCLERVSSLMGADIDVARKADAATCLLTYCNMAWDKPRAEGLLRKMEPLLATADLSPLTRAYWWLFLGYHYYIDARREPCDAAFEQSDRIADENGLIQTSLVSRVFRAYHLNQCWDFAAARRTLNEIPPFVNPARQMDIAQYRLAQTLHSTAIGARDDSVREAVEGLAAAERVNAPFFRVVWRACGAAALAVDGQFDRAEQWCVEAGQAARGTYLDCYRPALLLVRAWIQLKRGDRPGSHALLREAITAGRETRSEVFFRWTTVCMVAMFQEALENDIEASHVRHLIRRFGVPPPGVEALHWPWTVRLTTLGGFAIEVNGEPLVFSHKSPKKPLALLKALVAFGGRNVPLNRLADSVWYDEASESRRDSLASAIHRLRKLLGDTELLQVQDGRVSLDPRRCWADAWALTRLTEPGAAPAPETVAHVLGLYRGPFLPADEQAPWALSARERLRARTLAFLTAAGGVYERDGNFDGALACYERGIEVENLAEAMYQGAMRCLRALGRRAEAMATYRRLRQLLSVTLGVQPSAASDALFRSLAEE